MRCLCNATVTAAACAALCMAPVLAHAEGQIRSHILSHPEVIAETLRLEARDKAAEAKERAAILKQRRDEIFNDPSAPVGGNPQGDTTLVEFFDYNCLYCRNAAAILDALEREDKGVRLVFKEFPTLGPGSMFAARAALASQKQGQYRAFHKAMMAYRDVITEASVLEVAAQAGLDVDTLMKDIKNPAIDDAIRRDLALAGALHLEEPPVFIAGRQIRAGLIDLDALKQLIAEARKQ